MKLICAPMATLSHPAFRCLIESFGGCDEYFTEMINAPSLLNGGPFEKYYTDPSPVPEKLVWQLTGKSADSIIKAAERLKETECAGIDLNMGCCAPEIERSGAGIAWMLKPRGETEALVRGVNEILDSHENPKRFSVKLRLGDEHFTDESFFGFCDMLVQNGVKLITLHPRTKKEKYRDKPRWDYAQALAIRYRESGVKVYVNGDVCDSSSFKKVIGTCPDCEGVMIGRAAVQKPWIFALLHKSFLRNGAEDVTSLQVDYLDLCMQFIENVKIYQPEEFYKTRLQRFFTYFCDNLSFAHYAKTSFHNAGSVPDLISRVQEYFEKVPQDRIRNVMI